MRGLFININTLYWLMVLMANFHDRVQLLRFACGLGDEEGFYDHIKCVVGGENNSKSVAKQSVSRWMTGINFPKEKVRINVIDFFIPRFPNNEDLVRNILNPGMYWSVAKLLDELDVSYNEIEHTLTYLGVQEWNSRYHELPFMDALSKQAERDQTSTLIKGCMIGTYNMYRRHSTLPGILKERVVVETMHRADCRGTYYQYNKNNDEEPNKIEFNAFPCGGYVQAFGSFRRESKLEIIEVRVLTENSVPINGELSIAKDQKSFVGMLTGIYDYGNTLLAERIFIQKLNDYPVLDDKFRAGRLLADSETSRAEYHRVRDLVSNARDGQTLATRLSRLELE